LFFQRLLILLSANLNNLFLLLIFPFNFKFTLLFEVNCLVFKNEKRKVKIISPKNTRMVCRGIKCVYICSRFERRAWQEGREAGELNEE